MATSAELFRKALQEATKAYGAASELARKAGMKPPQLYKLMATDSSPSLDTLDRIAAALKTTPADLLGGVTPPPAVEVLQRELRAAQDEILRLKVELAEARAKPRPVSDPPEVEFLRSLPPTDPIWEILRSVMASKGKAGKKAK